ncbi:Hypothetical predicted protein [Mytilus galloprovincialis]|uniref:Uncharacterized protein n=1 Tax=Mytilus galloprovincialis TaxID=29158 RepID=A0A8B6FDZ0_MYTGA|nr:Hypothetical predicted protein [Mytilus galloprovincialis]
MWNGKGDFTQLSSGSRGFKQTSMSICIYIQPQPLICELTNFTGNDGFIDRFLFLVSRPALYPTSIVKEHYKILQESKLQNFVPVFLKMFENHTNGVTYSLSASAQEEYDKMTDSFAEFLDEKYKENDENNEDDKENIPTTQIDL